MATQYSDVCLSMGDRLLMLWKATVPSSSGIGESNQTAWPDQEGTTMLWNVRRIVQEFKQEDTQR